MKRVAGLSLVLALTLAGSALAQGGGMGGMGRPQAPLDHWITADSLFAALGVTDASNKAEVVQHLAEVNKILKTAADERQKRMQAGGGMPDSATRATMMNQMQEWQKGLDAHLGAVREALPGANRAAFDALQKPSVRPMGGRGGRMGGGPPGQ